LPDASISVNARFTVLFETPQSITLEPSA